ncbi:MAG TPA: FHA domain-containing protein [Lacunisphaera sp.]|nr:FHA domain-containing protein [Lacunisphaera sp.]
MPSLGDSLPPHAAWIELPDRRTHVLSADCLIGRTEENDIVNPDIRISRKHSMVQRQGSHYVLVDLGSTNGTFLNGNRIFKPTRLKDGDIILIGALEYTFCQPADAADADASEDSNVHRTAIVVGKISCWMLLVVPRRPVDADATDWLKAMRATLELGGASVKGLADDALLAHWREHRAPPERVRDSVLALSRRPVPAGAHLVLHFGAVRVGQGAAGTAENLLGAEVTFTHNLAAVAAKLNARFLLSESAVGSLGLDAQAKPLGSHAVGEIPGAHRLFGL